jgi:tetratricopeptide (TPR) repeat protein
MLPAASAVRAYSDVENDVTLILHMPGWDHDRLDKIEPLVRKLAGSQNWTNVIPITEQQMTQILGPTQNHDDPFAIKRFREFIGRESYDEVYYSHIVGGHAAQLCMRAYPNATRITYGESLGLMEDKDYVIASVTGSGWDENINPKQRKPEPEATKAVLILPADQTGDCLEGKELKIVPKSLALSVISEFQSSIPELNMYSQSLVQRQPCFLFILNNIADANFLTPEQEVSMYEEIARANVPKGASLILKGHPLATYPVDQMTAERLSNDFDVSIISPEFSRYPLEICEYLLKNTQVISLSYTSISIEYLYGRPVIYPFTKELVEKYFSEKTWNRYKGNDDFFRTLREALKTWDGKGVICSGKRVSFPPVSILVEDRGKAEEKNRTGVGLFQAGKVNDATQCFREAISLAPSNSEILSNLGIASWASKNQMDAIIYLSLAFSLNPNSRLVVLNLAQILISFDKKEAAKVVCFKYLSNNPQDTEIRDLYSRLN